METTQGGHTSVFCWISLLSVFWVPHICLDYVYHFDWHILSIPGSQYIFFAVTVVSGLWLAKTVGLGSVLPFLKDRWLLTCLVFFVAGVLISMRSFDHNIKLLLIWGVVSSVAALAAIRVSHQGERDQLRSVMLLSTPFFFTVSWGFFLEFLGPFEIGGLLQNIRQNYFDPPRWSTLHSSSNGFGFDAAMATVVAFVICRSTVNNPLRIIALILTVFGLVGVYFSGTRAAMLMVIVAFSLTAATELTRRHLLITILMSGLGFLVCFLYVGPEKIAAYLRLSGDMTTLSSFRWTAVMGSLAFLSESPFIGLGFGIADGAAPFKPTNMFYFVLPVEIGLPGAVAVYAAMVTPLFLLLQKTGWATEKDCFRQLNPAERCSFIGLVSVLVWLLAEFDVMRISANNQLFVFFWMFLFIHVKKGDRPLYGQSST